MISKIYQLQIMIIALWLMSCAKEATFSQRGPQEEEASGSVTKIETKKAALPKSNQDISKVFKITHKEKVELIFDAKSEVYSLDVPLKQDIRNRDLAFQQNDRTPVTKMFDQGSLGKNHEESFMQEQNRGVVDILIVVDNSGSMRSEQENLSTKLNPLLQELTETDWQIGVVTTDDGDPCMRAVIKKGEADIAQRFQDAIQAGTSGSGTERGIGQTLAGLKCQTPQWVRQGATLAVLIISDEDNCSSGCSSSSGQLPIDLANYIKDDLGKTLGSQARVYGLIWHPDDLTCSSASRRGYQYAEAISLTDGTYGSICDADYTTTLQSISANIASIVKTQFMLIATPDMNSLVVEVMPMGSSSYMPWSGYTLSDKLITFSDIPPLGSTVRMKYVSGKQGVHKSEFVLGESPAAGTVSVMVMEGSQMVQAPYTVDYQGGKVTFQNPPPDFSSIKVMYRKDTPLLVQFSIGGKAMDSSIKVYVNNASSSDYSYDKGMGYIKFNTPPVDNASIRVEFEDDEGPILDYDVGDIASILKSYDAANGDPISTSYAHPILSVAAGDHSPGKTLRLEFKKEGSDKKEISIPHKAIEGSISISSSAMDCAVGDGILIEGDKIYIDCELFDMAKFTISYEYENSPAKVFTLDEVIEPEKGDWYVKVDGEERFDFRREGSSVMIDEDLPEGAKVEIIFKAHHS